MPNLDLIYDVLPPAILLIPLVAFVVILFFGKWIDWMADKLAILAMFVSFVCSVALFASNVQDHGVRSQAAPVVTSFTWLKIETDYPAEAENITKDVTKKKSVDLQMGFLVDNLSAFMSMIVCGLATLVLIYSMFYMHADTMYRRYFGYMCFFCFAMLGIVFSNNLLMTFVFWELVGLGSYFLIGFWFYKPPVARDHHYQELKAPFATGIDERYLSPAHAQKKAFVMNRIGDFGFISGIGIFFYVMYHAAAVPGVANLNLLESPLAFTKLYAARESGVFEHVSLNLGFAVLSGEALLTLAGILTFMGAMGKSAQFPLHTWLPDAMQGPTTGSSIIHAATMVAAGVYMTARIHPLLNEGSLFFVAIIGGLTAFLAATMALVQWDIKAVLAYSTISQLGYMMLALGGNAYTAGVAHLYTHAIFKCMLFLCAGSVIHACHHLQDMHRLGGLRKKMPITFTTMLVGTLAISGVPLFSGFYSKDAILAGSLARAWEMGDVLHWIPFILGVITAGLTTFYMFRLIFMTFFGEPRDRKIYDQAHESPALATLPLVILAIFCVGGWWSGHLGSKPLPGLTVQVPVFHVKDGHVEKVMETKGWVDGLMVSPSSPEATGVLGDPAIYEKVHHWQHDAHVPATVISVVMVIIGFIAAALMYLVHVLTPATLLRLGPASMLYNLFSQLWFFDVLYQDGIVPLQKRINYWVWRFDAVVIDGILVDGWAGILKFWSGGARMFDNYVVDKAVDAFGGVTWVLGATARTVQAGKIQFYVCVTFGVAAIVLLGLLLAFPQ